MKTEDHDKLQLAVNSCADSALQARDSQEASERFANEARYHANKAITPPENVQRNTPDNTLPNNTYLHTFRNNAESWINANSWFNQLTHADLLTPGNKYWFVQSCLRFLRVVYC